MDIGLALAECNNLFKGERKYADAKQAYYKVYEELSCDEAMLKTRLICLARIMDCIWEKKKDAVNNDELTELVSEHHGQYTLYLKYLAKTPPKDIGSDVVLNTFGQHLHILLSEQEFSGNYNQSALVSCYDDIKSACQGKVQDKEIYEKWFSVIKEVSLEVHRSKLLESVETISGALLSLLPDSEEYRALKCAVFNLLANTALFFPTETDPRAIWKAVEEYLDKALGLVPGDIFAGTMRKNVRMLRMTNHQIRGFQHDINTHITRMYEWAKKIDDTNHYPSPKDMILSGIDALEGLANLAKQGNLSTDDCKRTDVAKLLEEIVVYHKLPPSVVCIEGQAQAWFISTGLVHVAIANLIKNSLEAYDRRCLPRPEKPCCIKIFYSDNKIIYSDFAGGITLEGDIFEPYMSEKGIHGDRGLGLTQARSAMRLQEYDLYLDQVQPAGGAAFVLDFNRKNSITGEKTHE